MLKRVFPDDKEYKEKFRIAIGALMVFPEPIPVEELKTLLGMSENECNDFIVRLEVFLKKGMFSGYKPTVEFEHRYIKDFL